MYSQKVAQLSILFVHSWADYWLTIASRYSIWLKEEEKNTEEASLLHLTIFIQVYQLKMKVLNHHFYGKNDNHRLRCVLYVWNLWTHESVQVHSSCFCTYIVINTGTHWHKGKIHFFSLQWSFSFQGKHPLNLLTASHLPRVPKLCKFW